MRSPNAIIFAETRTIGKYAARDLPGTMCFNIIGILGGVNWTSAAALQQPASQPLRNSSVNCKYYKPCKGKSKQKVCLRVWFSPDS